MQPAKAIDNVDVSTRRKLVAERNGGAFPLSEIGHFPQPKRTPRFGILDLLNGETAVTTRTSNGEPATIRVPHSILAVLVTVALACVGAGFWVVSSLTEMKTNLAVIQANQREAKATYSGNLRLMVAYTTNETNKVQFMTGLLTPGQQKQVFDWEKANPKPPLPNTDTEDPERNQ